MYVYLRVFLFLFVIRLLVISDSLDALSGDSEKLSKKFEDINSELHALQQILTSSTLYLPAHQIGRSQKVTRIVSYFLDIFVPFSRKSQRFRHKSGLHERNICQKRSFHSNLEKRKTLRNHR